MGRDIESFPPFFFFFFLHMHQPTIPRIKLTEQLRNQGTLTVGAWADGQMLVKNKQIFTPLMAGDVYKTYCDLFSRYHQHTL